MLEERNKKATLKSEVRKMKEIKIKDFKRRKEDPIHSSVMSHELSRLCISINLRMDRDGDKNHPKNSHHSYDFIPTKIL